MDRANQSMQACEDDICILYNIMIGCNIKVVKATVNIDNQYCRANYF